MGGGIDLAEYMLKKTKETFNTWLNLGLISSKSAIKNITGTTIYWI